MRGGGPGGARLVEHSLSLEPRLRPPGMFANYTHQILAGQVATVLQDLDLALQPRRPSEKKRAQEKKRDLSGPGPKEEEE